MIPPVWEEVWVCPDERGYLQATGIDDAGRKQYRYHSTYVMFMEQRKFQRLAYFSRGLSAVRRAVEVDVRCPVGSRHFAVATAVALIDGADEVEAVDVAAEALGNTRAVARSSYIDPLVLASSADELETIWKASRASRLRSHREGALAKLLTAPR